MLVNLKDDYKYDLKRPCYYLSVNRSLECPFRCALTFDDIGNGIPNPNITCANCNEYIDDSDNWIKDTIEDNNRL